MGLFQKDGEGLRARIKNRLKTAINQLSGEHSAAAPPEPTASYARPGVPKEDARVVMARLQRPVGSSEDGT
jgi:hypothetical protein